MISLEHVKFAGVDARLRRRAGLDLRLSSGDPHVEQRSNEDTTPCDENLSWILQRCGLDPEAYRPHVLQRRVPACLRKLKVPSLQEARKRLESRPDLLQDALSTVLIGASEWFRDSNVFTGLQQFVIPKLLEQRTGLKVLSAGCSDGQELYSIAMLLDEFRVLEQSRLLGLDCRSDAIRNGTAGQYPLSTVAQLPSKYLRYVDVVTTPHTARVIQKLRTAVQFHRVSLLNWNSAEHWDLILFRNMAMYLGPLESDSLFHKLVARLAGDGFLIVGKAEKPPMNAPLEKFGPCIYRRKNR